MAGLDSYIETLDSAEEAEEMKESKPTKEEYKNRIVREATFRRGTWKLRKKQDRSNKSTPPKSPQPKDNLSKGTKTKVHGDPPGQAPSDKEWFFDTYEKKGA
jgi:hypothetical protein